MKIVFVGYFSYATNYNRDLVVAFKKISRRSDRVFLCGRIDEKVADRKKPLVDRVWRKGWRYLPDILSYIRKHKPDVVYLHQEFKTYGGVFTALSFPILILILRLYGCKVVPTVHAVISDTQIGRNFLSSFALKDSFFSRVATKIFLKYAYFFIGFLSSSVTVHAAILKRILVDEYKVSSDKVEVIESGVREIKSRLVKIQKFSILEKFPTLSGKIILLIFGFFSPRKGFETIIKSFGKFLKENKLNKRYALVLAGDVTNEYFFYRKKIERLIESNDARKNILITGYVSGSEMDELFRLAKIVVLPAVISFNISGALAFALAYHKPVLASRVGPLRDEVEDNRIGLTYSSNSVESCRVKLQEILSNQDLYNTFLSNVSEVAKHRYWKTIAEQHYELFAHVLK